MIPTGWFLSYLLLWVYFKHDKGFFSGTNMIFKYDEYTGEEVSGVWEDLNEFDSDNENSQSNVTVLTVLDDVLKNVIERSEKNKHLNS